jgi:4-amino-4-deoxy-L-arabinose transferase-like glycosyltransferase
MPFLQEIVHKLEVGAGPRIFRIGASVLLVVLLIVGYNWRGFKNMGCQEAMDAAQVARNLSQGKGYTTLFVRPLSMYLVKKHTLETGGAGGGSHAGDLSQIKGMHPDLANPPGYPVLLAGAMKILPFHYLLPVKPLPFWSFGGKFFRYEPDFLIALVNQVLFFGVIVLTFFLARRLFDSRVAWLSSILLLCTEVLWRFSVSGLSTMLVMLIFMGLAWCLVLVEQEAREPKRGPVWVLVLAGLTGAVVAAGGLTRYAFGWLFIPVLLFLIVFGGKQRVMLALVATLTFAGIMTPWLLRNYNLSGTPFGTASFAVVQNTVLFPEHRLERSLQPDLGHLYPLLFWYKLMPNLRTIIQSDLPRLGGSWVTGFFLVGLLVGFRNPAIKRLRYFLVVSLVLLVVVQALGRTQLSEDSPEINSENLLVLLAPLVLVYGASLFFLLIDLIEFPFLLARYVAISAFSLVVCLPLIFVFLPPKGSAIVYPPYYPPLIQTIGSWLKETETTMSDVPWAMAWYGQRQSIWLTLNCMRDSKDPTTREDFITVNDSEKPINILYLTPVTMDAHFLSQWIKGGERSWGYFIVELLTSHKVPDYFPLSQTETGWLPDQVMLADWPRWRKPQ